jgi:hypothetical protein
MTFASRREVEMTGKYRKTKHALVAISEEIYEYAYDHYRLPYEWDGADVLVTSEPLAIDAKSDAGRLVIVTTAAPQIAWLFGRLRDAFPKMGNGALESQHYVRLGGVARAHELTSDGEYKVNGTLREVMNEAFVILEEMEKEEFAPSVFVGDERPKQFCPIIGAETLLEQTTPSNAAAG